METMYFSKIYKTMMIVGMLFLVFGASCNEKIYLYYSPIDGFDSHDLRIMNFIVERIGGYEMKSVQATLKRINSVLRKPLQGGVHCGVDSFALSERYHNDKVKWSKVIALNPDEWVVVYNSKVENKIKKYINTNGYFSNELEHLAFNVTDLYSPFLAVFRDPELKGGYSFDFSKKVPADIVANTLVLRSPLGGLNILRMIEKDRLDVTAVNLSSVVHARKKWGLKKLRFLRLEALGGVNRFDRSYYKIGLRCSESEAANRFMKMANSVVENHRGTQNFVYEVMKGLYADAAIEETLSFSKKLQLGDYDYKNIKFSKCEVYTTTIDQSSGGSQWKEVAMVRDVKAVVLRTSEAGFAIADAVKFEKLDENGRIIERYILDNVDDGYAQSGISEVVTTPEAYDGNFRYDPYPQISSSRWSKWEHPHPILGKAIVYMWWPKDMGIHKRLKAASVEIIYGEDCTTKTVDIG